MRVFDITCVWLIEPVKAKLRPKYALNQSFAQIFAKDLPGFNRDFFFTKMRPDEKLVTLFKRFTTIQ